MAAATEEEAAPTDLEQFPWIFDRGHDLEVDTSDNYCPILSTEPLLLTSGVWEWEVLVYGDYTSVGIALSGVPRQSWLGHHKDKQAGYPHFVTTNLDISEQVRDEKFCKYAEPFEGQLWRCRLSADEFTVDVFRSAKDAEEGLVEPKQYSFTNLEVVDDQPWHAVVGCNSQRSKVQLVRVVPPTLVKSAAKR